MLTLSDKMPNQTCQGLGRRDFLKAGALGGFGLGLGNLTLPGLLEAKTKALANGKPMRNKSVVLLFLQGGPPHIEFFDPKMSAPAEYRSITGEIPTKIPGVTFGSTFPQLAKMADKLAVVRSYQSRNGNHTYLSVTSGGNEMKAATSAVATRVGGTFDKASGMPNNCLVLPEAVEENLKLGSNFETGALHTLTDPGTLGSTYSAFNPAGGGTAKENMKLLISPDRLADRKGLLGGLDGIKRNLDADGSLEGADYFAQQAFDVVTKGISSAFDLTKEDPKTLEKYDTRPLFDARKLQRWGDMRRATNLLGLQMLMARRLCESGCSFVTVSDCGWDYHANNNSPKGMAGLHPMGNQVDHAVATFVQDLHDRGLNEDVLLIVTGEMGRSPKLNSNGGRGHYGDLTSLLLAGGGLKVGQVVGESDSLAAFPATRPYGPENLSATILHHLFDLGELRLMDGIPAEILAMANDQPIEELF
jgi:uncharacterized protein (DUF1501 family)